MSWEKVWLVLRREYLVNFRRPSFLFTAFGLPAITLGLMFVIFQFTDKRETNLDRYQRIGYLDRAGVVVAGAPNPDHYQPVIDPSLEVPDQPDAAFFGALEAYAQQQLADKQLDAYFVISAEYVLTGQVDIYARKNIPEALKDNIETFMRSQIAAQAPVTLAVPAERLGKPTDLKLRDLDTGKELTEAQMAGRLMLPFIFVFIYFMASNTTAQFLMSGVVEEKENRLMEILATSLRPLELLWGKVLGLGALSLTQVAVWVAAGLAIAASNPDAREFLSGASFRAGDLLLVAALFVINFLLFAAMMMAVGASVTAEAESRQVAGLFTLVMVAPMALLVTFFTNPNGPLPVFFSFFPLTAALGLILRLGLTTLPGWQIALSVVIQVVTTIGIMWLAAKIFRLGMLMYGKPLTPRALWRALREGKLTLTTAQAEMATPKKKRSLFGR